MYTTRRNPFGRKNNIRENMNTFLMITYYKRVKKKEDKKKEKGRSNEPSRVDLSRDVGRFRGQGRFRPF